MIAEQNQEKGTDHVPNSFSTAPRYVKYPTNSNCGCPPAVGFGHTRHSAPDKNVTLCSVGHVLLHSARCARSCTRGNGVSVPAPPVDDRALGGPVLAPPPPRAA